MAGLQCHRRLWWATHDRGAPELSPDPALQAVFAQGSCVGALARDVAPGGVLVELDPRDPLKAVEQTRALIDSGAPIIYEACLLAEGVFVAIDILSRRGRGWVVTEVKSTLSVKPQHVQDAAVQAWVAREHGLRVRAIEVVHLNRDHRHPDDGPLFVRTDVTAKAEAFLDGLPAELAAQTAMLATTLPHVEPGAHCSTPYACPFMNRCWPRRPRHHVSELYCIGRSRLSELQSAGYVTIHDLPADAEPPGVRERQLRAVQTGRPVVDHGLADALAPIVGTIAYLDFETVAPALPAWRGCGPYDGVPVQFSVHRRHGDGSLSHAEFLSRDACDPRESLAQSLLGALEGADVIVAW